MKNTNIISVIDFETKGTTHQVSEFAFVRFSKEGKLIDFWEIEIKNNDSLRNYWDIINKKINNSIIVAHNLGFDFNLLIKEFPLFQFHNKIDTLYFIKEIYQKQIADYSLTNLLYTFNLYEIVAKEKLNNHFNPHRALFDCYACGILFFHILKKEKLEYFLTNSDNNLLF